MKALSRLWKRLAAILLSIVVVLIAIVFYMVAMPGKSFSGVLPPLTAEETEIKANLTKHISYLADEIGERNVIAYEPLQKTAQGSQRYPTRFKSFYPSKGNFVAFIGNLGSRGLVRDAVCSFRASVKFPSEGAQFPESDGRIIGRSGRKAIPPSWLRTLRLFAIRITISLPTDPIR